MKRRFKLYLITFVVDERRPSGEVVLEGRRWERVHRAIDDDHAWRQAFSYRSTFRKHNFRCLQVFSLTKLDTPKEKES